MSPLSVKYNYIICHQQEVQDITYFLYQSMSSVDMTVEYNNLLQSKDFKETFTSMLNIVPFGAAVLEKKIFFITYKRYCESYLKSYSPW